MSSARRSKSSIGYPRSFITAMISASACASASGGSSTKRAWADGGLRLLDRVGYQPARHRCVLEAHDDPVRRARALALPAAVRSEEHTSELQSHSDLVCRLLLEK